MLSKTTSFIGLAFAAGSLHEAVSIAKPYQSHAAVMAATPSGDSQRRLGELMREHIFANDPSWVQRKVLETSRIALWGPDILGLLASATTVIGSYRITKDIVGGKWLVSLSILALALRILATVQRHTSQVYTREPMRQGIFVHLDQEELESWRQTYRSIERLEKTANAIDAVAWILLIVPTANTALKELVAHTEMTDLERCTHTCYHIFGNVLAGFIGFETVTHHNDALCESHNPTQQGRVRWCANKSAAFERIAPLFGGIDAFNELPFLDIGERRVSLTNFCVRPNEGIIRMRGIKPDGHRFVTHQVDDTFITICEQQTGSANITWFYGINKPDPEAGGKRINQTGLLLSSPFVGEGLDLDDAQEQELRAHIMPVIKAARR